MNVRRDHRANHGLTLAAATALITLLSAAIAAGSSNKSAEDAELKPTQAACGTPGKPACPLQAWMRANLGAPLASSDMDGLASGLERAAKLSPDATWRSWEAFSKRGAEAAKKGDIKRVRASCKGCHDAWREAYRAQYRARPLPR